LYNVLFLSPVTQFINSKELTLYFYLYLFVVLVFQLCQ
jgi:hypothetical protein